MRAMRERVENLFAGCLEVEELRRKPGFFRERRPQDARLWRQLLRDAALPQALAADASVAEGALDALGAVAGKFGLGLAVTYLERCHAE